MWYLHDDPKSWCRLCPGQSVDDVRHVLGWCHNIIYKEIRTRWYERLRDRATILAPALWDAIHSGLRCVHVKLQTATGAAVDAWHAVTGKIPILWTEAALGAGVERLNYEKWLRLYGKEVRAAL